MRCAGAENKTPRAGSRQQGVDLSLQKVPYGVPLTTTVITTTRIGELNTIKGPRRGCCEELNEKTPALAS